MSEPGDEPEGKEGEIKFSINSQAFSYLQWLVKNTTLGRGRNEVARQLLIQRLTEMKGENYKVDKL